MITHGMHGTATYKCWEQVKQRCLNPKNPDYKHYGGRGITFCAAWLKFEGFLADMGVRPGKLELDRINNDGDYGPGNCRWATRTQQVRNQGLRSDNTSGVSGVYWNKRNKKWQVQITVSSKHIHLGYFADIENAIKARKQGEILYFGDNV